MALFPTDNIRPEEEATRRRAVMQEAGTRKLVVGFVLLLAVWFAGSKVWDAYLLRRNWPPLAADEAGLTIVGTLDRRGSYDNNLFKVVQSEGQARAELTDYGWDGIFNGRHGPLSTTRVGHAIRGAANLDSDTGYAMLAPILAAEVRRQMGDAHAYDALSEDIQITTSVPMTDDERPRKHIPARAKPMRELVQFFEHEAASKSGGDSPVEGGSGTDQHVEHGLTIPADTLVHVCPVILTGMHFTRGRVEEHPEVIMGGKTYSVWLDLTPEGRSRFYQWSHGHVNESLLLILKGEVVAHGRMVMTMDVSTWEITNLKDRVAAQKLVDYINARHGEH